MKVHDPNLKPLGSANVSPADAAGKTAPKGVGTRPAEGQSGDGVHLSNLVRTLRALSADSLERHARVEELARAYASGTYQVDTEATAAKLVDDALLPNTSR